MAALAQAKVLYEEGLSGMETEFSRYMEAEAVLEQGGVPREQLTAQRAVSVKQLQEEPTIGRLSDRIGTSRCPA